MTSIATWITNTFMEFDYNILSAIHEVALVGSNVLTPIAKVLAIIGTMPGMLLGWVAIFCFLFMKDKHLGMYLGGSIAVALCMNLVIKAIVQRPRPYNLELVKEYLDWWKYVGSNVEETYSFTSGHTCIAMSQITAFFIWSKKKSVAWLAYIYVFVMAFSRMYLCVHYPSDVLAALVVGLIAAIISHYIIQGIDWWCNKYQNNFFSKFVLTGKLK